MSGWTRHEGDALALEMDNIDTDQLIPARFMSTPRSEGYGKFLLYDVRHDADGRPTDHRLNRATPSILIAGRNFGAGSSREAAVYALVDYGIRAVVAPSFGDIFASNAVNNGLCPAVVTPDVATALMAAAGDAEVPAAIDLETSTITCGGTTAAFTLDPVWRMKLMNGWDDIALTMHHADEIAAFAEARRGAAPWVWPGAGGT